MIKTFILLGFLSLPVFSAIPDQDLPQVVVQEISPVLDTKRILIPVRVEAKIQSLVSAESEGHITKIVKPLGSIVKANETILFIENKDPGFTYAAVPVRSPISGVVSQLWVSDMTKVVRGDKLLTVINPQSLKLTAEFPSSELSYLKSGQIGTFNTELPSDKKFEIKISGISPLVDTRTGTATAELEFLGTQESLPAIGTMGQVLFEIQNGHVILIPEAALVYQDGKPLIRIVKGQNEFLKKPIELGEQRDSQFVVKSGLNTGEKLIVRTSRALKQNDRLDIQAPEKAHP